MSFSGAPNVIHVKTNGDDSKDGSSWQLAVKSVTKAVTIAMGKQGKTLILIAPGRYVGADARAAVFSTNNLKFQGAGPGTVLEETDPAARSLIMLDDADSVEFSDLTLVNSSSSGDQVVILNGLAGPQQCRGLTITRCRISGGRAVQAYKCKDVLLKKCMISGAKSALEFGNQADVETELYACVASDCDFRVESTSAADAQAIVVDGGELTAMNCNCAAIAASSGSNRYSAFRVSNGGQIVLTNCEATVDGSGTATVHVVVDVVGTTARMKLTACSILAKGGTGPQSISPAKTGNESRLQADVSLLTPVWT